MLDGDDPILCICNTSQNFLFGYVDKKMSKEIQQTPIVYLPRYVNVKGQVLFTSFFAEKSISKWLFNAL